MNDAFTTAVRESTRKLRDGEAQVRAGREIEGVHLMRTSARRLRASMKFLGGHLGPAREPLQRGLKRLMGSLGPLRDVDVLAQAIDGVPLEAADATRLKANVAARRQRPLLRMREAIDGIEYRALLAGLDTAPPCADPATPLFAPARVLRAVAGVIACRPAEWATAADASLHELRKSIKKLRYALEAYAPAFGRPVARMTGACRDLQESLGAIQDAAMFGEILRGVRSFAAGQFVATVRGRAEGVRSCLPDLWQQAFGPRVLGKLGAHLLRRSVKPAEETPEAPASSQSA
jgi:CHAD domain-containing protein